MASFISVPLKKTYEVDLVKPLKTFIKNTFSQANPDDYNPALTEFNKLRTSVITKGVDKHESSLEVLYRYYDQLSAIGNKLPIAENQIRVQFKWRDAFDEGSFLSGKKNLAIASASYEQACILFNIAALQSQVASVQSHENNDGLKLTVKLFQQSSGIYGHLKDTILSHVRQDPTQDLNPDALHALSALMLAQAQESIFRKATQDKMKEAMIAKLALQTSDLYSDAVKLMQLASIKDLWPKDWLPLVTIKQAFFHGMAEFYQSVVAQQTKSYGEEIARLQRAKELLLTSQNKGVASFNFRQELSRVEQALEKALKDNNFIYHDKVPDLKMLQPIGKAVVAKATPISHPMCAKFSDLFEKLVPLPVHGALASFENRKSQVANMELGRLRTATDLMNSVLASLNLPAALEDLSGERVPQSLLDKAQQLREMGGLASIDKLMNDLPDLLTRNREILDESIRVLDDEAKSDQQLKEQFKDKWSRTPSASLTSPMRDEAGKYKTILDTAVSADKIVREKYNTHKNAISLLSKPKAELEAALPAAIAASSLQKSSVVTRLRELLEKVNTIKAEREVIETEIKDAKFDMSSKFFAALASDGAINEEAISEAELDKVYSPLREQVTDSLHRQEILLSLIQNDNTEFCNAKTSGQGAVQREKQLKDLAAGFDSFMELMNNLEEGTKFYNDLTPLLVRLQSKINDFCFARKTEKEDLLADLQKTIANAPSQEPPVVPRYQAGGAGQPSQASGTTTSTTATSTAGPKPAPRGPPRPPPPAIPSAAAAVPATTTTTPAASNPAPAASTPTVSATNTGQATSTSQATAPPAYTPDPGQPGQPGQMTNPYGPPGGWQPPPYMAYPGQGYPPVQMPGSFNPYNPYMAYPLPGLQPPYPPAGHYNPYMPPGQPYPGQPPYPQQQPPPGQTGYPYPGYPQQQ